MFRTKLLQLSTGKGFYHVEAATKGDRRDWRKTRSQPIWRPSKQLGGSLGLQTTSAIGQAWGLNSIIFHASAPFNWQILSTKLRYSLDVIGDLDIQVKQCGAFLC